MLGDQYQQQPQHMISASLRLATQAQQSAQIEQGMRDDNPQAREFFGPER